MAIKIQEPLDENPETIDWQKTLHKLTKTDGGYFFAGLSNMDNLDEPQVLAGSRFEINGSFYEATSNEIIDSLETIPVNRIAYIYAVPDVDGCHFEYSLNAPLLDYALGGFYSGAARALWTVFKITESSFFMKRALKINNHTVEALCLPAATPDSTDTPIYDISGAEYHRILLEKGIYKIELIGGGSGGGGGGAGGVSFNNRNRTTHSGNAGTKAVTGLRILPFLFIPDFLQRTVKVPAGGGGGNMNTGTAPSGEDKINLVGIPYETDGNNGTTGSDLGGAGGGGSNKNGNDAVFITGTGQLVTGSGPGSGGGGATGALSFVKIAEFIAIAFGAPGAGGGGGGGNDAQSGPVAGNGFPGTSSENATFYFSHGLFDGPDSSDYIQHSMGAMGGEKGIGGLRNFNEAGDGGDGGDGGRGGKGAIIVNVPETQELFISTGSYAGGGNPGTDNSYPAVNGTAGGDAQPGGVKVFKVA